MAQLRVDSCDWVSTAATEIYILYIFESLDPNKILLAGHFNGMLTLFSATVEAWTMETSPTASILSEGSLLSVDAKNKIK